MIDNDSEFKAPPSGSLKGSFHRLWPVWGAMASFWWDAGGMSVKQVGQEVNKAREEDLFERRVFFDPETEEFLWEGVFTRGRSAVLRPGKGGEWTLTWESGTGKPSRHLGKSILDRWPKRDRLSLLRQEFGCSSEEALRFLGVM